MALKTKKNSLAEKINSLITTTPANFGSDDENEETKAKVVEPYDETDDSDSNIQYSKIRRQNAATLDQLDERYTGKKVSRKDIYENDSVGSSDNSDNDESVEDEEGEEMESIEGENVSDMNSDEEIDDENEDTNDESDDHSNEDETNDEEHSGNSDDESDGDDKYDVDIGNPLYRDRRDPKFKTMSDVNVRADIEKGNCVRSQLKLWESLLEMRIKLQKCVITSNQMPQYDTYKDYKTDSEFMKNTNETKSKLTVLLNNMLQLQQSLLKQYPETKNLSTENRKRKADEDNENDSMDEEIPSDTEDEVEKPSDSEETEVKETVPKKKLKFVDYEKVLSENHKIYAEYRNSVIQKWNDKTRISTGKANKGMSQTTLKQIEFALSDRQKLQKKTQLKRSEYEIVGKTIKEDSEERRTQEYDPEIYDDDDFYHQLLRDLIEYKSSDVTDPIQLSKQWIQLQNMRSKMKRKIDTRATKGRKIRYNVHNKLVNFMAPITVHDTWTDLAKNELYNSLFGKLAPTEGAVSQ